MCQMFSASLDPFSTLLSPALRMERQFSTNCFNQVPTPSSFLKILFQIYAERRTDLKTASLPWAMAPSITTAIGGKRSFFLFQVGKFWPLPHPFEFENGYIFHPLSIIVNKAHLPQYSGGSKDNSPLLSYTLASFDNYFLNTLLYALKIWKWTKQILPPWNL